MFGIVYEAYGQFKAVHKEFYSMEEARTFATIENLLKFKVIPLQETMIFSNVTLDIGSV